MAPNGIWISDGNVWQIELDVKIEVILAKNRELAGTIDKICRVNWGSSEKIRELELNLKLLQTPGIVASVFEYSKIKKDLAILRRYHLNAIRRMEELQKNLRLNCAIISALRKERESLATKIYVFKDEHENRFREQKEA